MTSPQLIEDVLREGLQIVFCGTALGRRSFEQKAYYAHPRNMFWRALYEVGLTDRQLKPEEYRQVLDYRLGLTDLCKSEFGNDNELSPRALDRAGLQKKIETYRPAVLAFTSQKAGRAFCGNRAVFGWQPESIPGTRIYILPSTSPAARWNWGANSQHWKMLAEVARASASN